MLAILALLPLSASAHECPEVDFGHGLVERPQHVDGLDGEGNLHGDTVADTPVCVRFDESTDRDTANAALLWAEQAWIRQIDRIGYEVPLRAEDTGRYDIFLTAGPREVDPHALTWFDHEKGDGKMSTTAFVDIDPRVGPVELRGDVTFSVAMGSLFATDFTETTQLPPMWATATATQRCTWEDGAAWEKDVPMFQAHPYLPILAGQHEAPLRHSELWHQYMRGSALWVAALDVRHGLGDCSWVGQLWQTAANEGWEREPDIIDALEIETGRPLGLVMAEIAMSRWRMGDRWTEHDLPEAAGWGPEMLPMVAHDLTRRSLPATVDFGHGLYTTGQGFVRVALDGPPRKDQLVQVTVDSAEGLNASLVVMWSDDRGRHGARVDTGLNPGVMVPRGRVDELIIGVTNLGPDGWEPEDFAWTPGDHEVTVRLVRRGGLRDPRKGTDLQPVFDGGVPDLGPRLGDGPGEELTETERPLQAGEERGGCGCSATGGLAAGWIGGFSALIAFLRRRR